MPDQYARSIFAVELNRVLDEHRLKLDALTRKPLVFSSRTVNRLVVSLTHVKPLPALNQGEIITLVKQLRLSHDDYLRIYAALIALGVQRFMLDYVSPARSWQIADEVRKEVLEAQRRNPSLSTDFLTRRVFPNSQGNSIQETDTSVVGSNQDTDAAPIPGPLDDALDYYDEGVRLSALGLLDADVEEGRMLLEQAQVYVQKAQHLLERLPRSVHETEEWKYWHEQAQEQALSVEEALE